MFVFWHENGRQVILRPQNGWQVTLTSQNVSYLTWTWLTSHLDTTKLGDNCIVFENFTASIGDLMVANWVYWRRVSGASKWIFATIKSTIDAVKFQIQYSYPHSNVIMCRIDIHTCTSYTNVYMYISVLLTRWNKR